MQRVCLIFILSFIFFPGQAWAERLVLASDYWCPFICDESEVGQAGISIDIARQIFNAAGYEVEFVAVNWKRAVQETRHGQFNGLVDAARVDAPDFIFPSQSLYSQSSCLFAGRASKWLYHDLKSLEHVRLGAIGGYHYTDELDAYIRQNAQSGQVSFIHGDHALARNVQRVERGMIDVLVEDSHVMEWYFTYSTSSTLRLVGCMDQKTALYIAFSPARRDSEKLAEILSEGIIRLRENGELEKIYAQYGIHYSNQRVE
jgi:polar amino acid transport system substrate-binding protein